MDSYIKKWNEHFKTNILNNIDIITDYRIFLRDDVFSWDLIDVFPTTNYALMNRRTIKGRSYTIWSDITKKPSMTLDIYRKYPNKPWCMKFLSLNESITIDDIMNNLDIPWDDYYVSKRKDVNLDVIRKYPEYGWNWEALSVYMPIEVIMNNLNHPWNNTHMGIHRRPDLSFDMFRRYPNYPWLWNEIRHRVNEKINLDTLLASDITSGWNILEIAEAYQILPDDIRRKFPNEFDIYCRTNHIYPHNILVVVGNIERQIRINNPINPHEISEKFINSLLEKKDEFIDELAKKDHSDRLKLVHKELEELMLRGDNLEYSARVLKLKAFEGTIFSEHC